MLRWEPESGGGPQLEPFIRFEHAFEVWPLHLVDALKSIEINFYDFEFDIMNEIDYSMHNHHDYN